MHEIIEKVYRHKGWLIGLLVIIVLFAGGLSLYRRAVPVVTPHVVLKNVLSSGESIPPSVSWSPYGEQSMAVVGQNLSANYGAEKPLPTASIAKVMTALAILKEKPLDLGEQGPKMTVSASDVATYQQELAQNESVVQVSVGEELSEYQIIQAMLVPSGTNTADSAAVWAFGSMSSYLQFANHYAAQLGMTHTQFAGDASGFSPETVSTPQDLIKLGEAAMNNPVIAQVVGQSSITLPVAGPMQNFDTDLGVNGIIGIKTGNTDQAGGAFLFAAKYHTQVIVGAIMGAPDLGTALHDAPEVLGSFESQLQFATPVEEGQTVGTYQLPWGGTARAVTQKSLAVVDWHGTKPGIQVSLQRLSGREKTGAIVGQVALTYHGGTTTVPVVLQGSAGKPTLLWRIFHL